MFFGGIVVREVLGCSELVASGQSICPLGTIRSRSIEDLQGCYHVCNALSRLFGRGGLQQGTLDSIV